LGLNTTASAEKPSILLTFDVEDWFQVENLKSQIPVSTWHQRELRVQKNTDLILDLLDSFDFGPKATFFVLGWVARKCPDLVQNIAQRGHEVASHGFGHGLCSQMTPKELAQDLDMSRKMLEDMLGLPVSGYRAPSFSITPTALNLIQKAGYRYDSSYNSFSGHGRYGKFDFSQFSKHRGSVCISPDFCEVPVSNFEFRGRVLPLGGGGYFRLLPQAFFKLGMQSVLKKQNAFVFYAHPWEFDPDQPRVIGIHPWLKFRHYTSLNRTASKLAAMIQAFKWARFETVSRFLAQMPC
jgi:polysaccharide deacetylase family protein (PEP-CTERM system associated)